MLPGKIYTPEDIFRLAKRRAWIVVVLTIVGAVSAFMVSKRLPSLYLLGSVDPVRSAAHSNEYVSRSRARAPTTGSRC